MARWVQIYNVDFISIKDGTPKTWQKVAYGRIPVLCTTVAADGEKNLGDFASLKNWVQDNWNFNLYNENIPSFHTKPGSFDYDLSYWEPEGGWGRWHCGYSDITDLAYAYTTSPYREYLSIRINDEYAYTFIERLGGQWQQSKSIFKCNSDGTVTEVSGGFMVGYSFFGCWQQTRRVNYSMLEGQLPMLLFLDPTDNDNPTHSAIITWKCDGGGPGRPHYSCTISDFRSLGTPNETSLSPVNPASVGGRSWTYGADPYENIVPESDGEGGEALGTGNFWSEEVPAPGELTYSSADTGFTRIYNPTISQLKDFSMYMWTDQSLLQTLWNHIKQYFEDPMDAFIALNLLPVQVPNGTAEEVKLLFLGTGKYMNPALNQFVTVELGQITLSEKYGSALDYSPNTKIDLFLPFIGTVPIDADEVMGKTVKLTYKVDICTGICTAILLVQLLLENGEPSWFPLYQYSGNCAIRIPFSSANMDGYINAGMQVAKLAAGAVAGGALGAAAAASTSTPLSSTASANAGTGLSTDVASSVPAPVMGGVGAIDRYAAGVAHDAKMSSLFNQAATMSKNISRNIGIVSGAKAGFPHTSGFAGNAGYMGYKVPFFIMKVPRLVNPENYGKYNGYPSLTYQLFSNLSGYTEVQQVQLTNINATANELDEIQSILKSGVIM